MHCRRPRNHAQGTDLAEVRCELFRHAIGKIFLGWVAREVLERQHGERMNFGFTPRAAPAEQSIAPAAYGRR